MSYIGFIENAGVKMSVFNLSSNEAEALAKKLSLRFYRTSLKENLNVDEGLCFCNKWHGSTKTFLSLNCFILLTVLWQLKGNNSV